MVHDSDFTVHDSQFTIHGSRYTIRRIERERGEGGKEREREREKKRQRDRGTHVQGRKVGEKELMARDIGGREGAQGQAESLGTQT